MYKKLQDILEKSFSIKQRILSDGYWAQLLETTVELLIVSLKNGGRIHFCGNGGSAADAQHLSAELSGRFYHNRPALNAEALHCNTSYITAVGNDYGFEEVYARLLKGTGKAGDVLLAFSTSGTSTNIVRVAHVAQDMQIPVVAFTGESGGQLKEMSTVLFNVPSQDTPRIQETHILLGHIICETVENFFFHT